MILDEFGSDDFLCKKCYRKKQAYEIDPWLLAEISGGCSCDGKRVTRTDNGEGKVTYTVDEDRTQ